MGSEAESSSGRGSFFAGNYRRRTEESLMAMAEVVKCSLEGKSSGGRDMQSNSPIETGSAPRGCPDGEGKRMEDDRHSSPEDNGKGGNCRSRDRSPPRDSQGWISVLKRQNDRLVLPGRRCTGSAPTPWSSV